MLNVNNVILAGNLTRDPELRQVGADKSVCNFSLAINRRWKDANGEVKEDATFVDCEAWGRTAELISQYLAKGSGAYVEGRLKLETWQDKEGKNRSRLKVLVDTVQFLTFKDKDKGSATNQGNAAPGAPAAGGEKKPAGRPANAGDDEPPF